MNFTYEKLLNKSLNNEIISEDEIKWILTDKEVELLPLLYTAYKVRYKYFENKVKIHVINNVKNGNCSENCSYCAQSKESVNKIEKYPIREKQEILADAKVAYENGTYRYCLVFAGSRQNDKDMEYICDVVKDIKANYKMEVCVSAGFLDEKKVNLLKNAGVNRYNHNLNTSSGYYGSICSSHTYKDRVDTIKLAKGGGLDICSGVILGMGETLDDLVKITRELKDINVQSIPVNFFIPVEGHRIKDYQKLTPEYCLKLLSIFRLCLPKAEIRIAGGREYHLRGMQILSLYPCNSLFANGYLNIAGDPLAETKKMIEDGGFVVDRIEY